MSTRIVPIGLRDVLAQGRWASPCRAYRRSAACCAGEGGWILSAHVVGTGVLSVLGIISWWVVTAGAEKSVHTCEHWEGHVQKLRTCSKPRAKQVRYGCARTSIKMESGDWNLRR